MSADGLFFNRSGYVHSPGISTLFWMGDQIKSWDAYDGLKSAITGSLSSGLSGFSLTHSDIGVFTPIGSTLSGTDIEVSLLQWSKELLLRWAEYSAFTPVMRTHEGIDPAAAWQIDQDGDTLAAFRHCVQMYQAWAPYRRQLVDEAARTGHPVTRALALHYPHDPVATGQQFQYLLGEVVFVHPVTGAGVTEVQVYLPAGKWTHVWTARQHAGPGMVTVPRRSAGHRSSFTPMRATSTSCPRRCGVWDEELSRGRCAARQRRAPGPAGRCPRSRSRDRSLVAEQPDTAEQDGNPTSRARHSMPLRTLRTSGRSRLASSAAETPSCRRHETP